ncbi:MAG: ABC transporter permease, partial [Planctomycetaceae bacterium]|nr:ABC transporter permease [Planctomycetaceae bacterium]
MFRLILNSILYYRRTQLAVLLAVAVSTAVIAGALIVGDSMRTSLRVMSLERLGGITHVLHSPRFIRQQLADEIRESLAASSATDAGASAHEHVVAPALLMSGTIELTTGADTDREIRRAGAVELLAVDTAGWSLLETADLPVPSERGIILGHRTADELQVEVGQEISVWVELPSTIPRDSLLGERDETVREIVLTVEGLLPEFAGASRFSLNPRTVPALLTWP